MNFYVPFVLRHSVQYTVTSHIMLASCYCYVRYPFVCEFVIHIAVRGDCFQPQVFVPPRVVCHVLLALYAPVILPYLCGCHACIFTFLYYII